MKLFVEIQQVYGKPTLYPACEKSKLLAELIGAKTITESKLKTIRALGYQVFESPASANKRRNLFKGIEEAA